jgi:hypothetical protein
MAGRLASKTANRQDNKKARPQAGNEARLQIAVPF